MIMQGQLETATLLTGDTARSRLGGFPEKLLYWMGRSVVSLYTHTLLRMDVTWQSPFPEGPKILAANHPTTTDPFLILTLLPEPVSVLVTGGTFDIPVFGAYLRRTGHVPVVRDSRDRTVREAKELLEDGRSVAIFPEGALSPFEDSIGSRHGSLGFHRPHTSVARLALSTGAPVIPVGIGLDPGRVRVVGVRMEGQDEEARIYSGGPYTMTVGQPMWFQGNAGNWDYVQLVSDQIMNRIAQLSHEGTHRLSRSPAAASIQQSREPSLSGATVSRA